MIESVKKRIRDILIDSVIDQMHDGGLRHDIAAGGLIGVDDLTDQTLMDNFLEGFDSDDDYVEQEVLPQRIADESVDTFEWLVTQQPEYAAHWAPPVPVLSKSTRELLEWSWNYAIAESLEGDTTKGVARAIAYGLMPGKDADDRQLLRDFLSSRVDNLTTLTLRDPDQWGRPDWEVIQADLLRHPDYPALAKSIGEERAEEEAEGINEVQNLAGDDE